jgi:hypothetical protein
VIAAVIAFAVIVLVLALVVAVGLEPGPSPGEVAVSYELAWDRLDFDALWTLSGDELRDGRSRKEFTNDKRQAYAGQRELAGLARDVQLDEVLKGSELAAVRTRVTLQDGTTVRNQVQLALREGTWKVIGYHLEPDGSPADPHASR